MSEVDETSLSGGSGGVSETDARYGPPRGLRRTGGGVLADLRLLGFGGNDIPTHTPLELARGKALLALLNSSNPKDQARGLRYFAAYERERRATTGLALEFAGKVIEAQAMKEVGVDSTEAGATPEALSREVSEIVRQNGVEASGAPAPPAEE